MHRIESEKRFSAQCLSIASAPDYSPFVRPVEVQDYISSELFPQLESVMLGIRHAQEEPNQSRENLSKIDSGSVVEELKTFVKECKSFWLYL